MIFRFALFVVLLISVISPVIYFSDFMFLYNEKRILQSVSLIFTGVLTLIISREQLKETLNQLPKYFWVTFVSIFCLLMVSTWFAPFPFYSTVEISLFLILVWVGLITANVIQNHSYAQYIVLGAACIFGLLYGIKFSVGYTFFLLGYESFPLWPAWGIKEGITGFSNVRFFNQVQSSTLPLLTGGIIWALSQKQKGVSYILVFLTAIWWMLLIQSAGRGIVLSVLIAALLVLFCFKEASHQWIWVFLGSLLIGFLAKLVLFEIIPQTEPTRSILRGGSSRLELWPKLFLSTLKRPILGHGPMSFASINTEYFRGHPHNSLLQFLYELGYPVTIMIIGSVFYALKKWIEQTKQRLKAIKNEADFEIILRISLSAALFGGIIYSLFSGVIVMPLSQLWLVLVAGTMIGLYSKEYQSEEVQSQKISSAQVLSTKIILLLSSITLLGVLIKDVPNLQENERRFVKETNKYVFRPRFWQQGKIGLVDKDVFEQIKLNLKQEN